MTATLISLISVFVGIIAGILTGIIFKSKSIGLIGNILAGVFGSIFFIKSIGRLGLDPVSIIESGNVNTYLLIGNFTISFLGGMVGVIIGNKLKRILNQDLNFNK